MSRSRWRGHGRHPTFWPAVIWTAGLLAITVASVITHHYPH